LWIFTDTGFISAVRKPEYPEVLTVRARDKASLEALAARSQTEIKRSPFGDYPYRLFISDELFTDWLLERSSELDYSNFKSRVAKTRGSKFVAALNNVWVAMLAVEDQDSRVELFDEDGNQLRHSDVKVAGKQLAADSKNSKEENNE